MLGRASCPWRVVGTGSRGGRYTVVDYRPRGRWRETGRGDEERPGKASWVMLSRPGSVSTHGYMHVDTRCMGKEAVTRD